MGDAVIHLLRFLVWLAAIIALGLLGAFAYRRTPPARQARHARRIDAAFDTHPDADEIEQLFADALAEQPPDTDPRPHSP